jgi:hypothetical protein
MPFSTLQMPRRPASTNGDFGAHAKIEQNFTRHYWPPTTPAPLAIAWTSARRLPARNLRGSPCASRKPRPGRSSLNCRNRARQFSRFVHSWRHLKPCNWPGTTLCKISTRLFTSRPKWGVSYVSADGSGFGFDAQYRHRDAGARRHRRHCDFPDAVLPGLISAIKCPGWPSRHHSRGSDRNLPSR